MSLDGIFAAPAPHCDATSQMLSIMHQQKFVRMTDSMPNFFSLLKKKNRFQAALTTLSVSRPGEIVTDMHPEEPEAADPFHYRSVDQPLKALHDEQ